ncbi:hypothetical protein HYX00_02575 [Candidatus Woesearchaeota archaeon]|nr:hypothetical protein [Candidatus Woesearchaeota archaeon]
MIKRNFLLSLIILISLSLNSSFIFAYDAGCYTTNPCYGGCTSTGWCVSSTPICRDVVTPRPCTAEDCVNLGYTYISSACYIAYSPSLPTGYYSLGDGCFTQQQCSDYGGQLKGPSCVTGCYPQGVCSNAYCSSGIALNEPPYNTNYCSSSQRNCDYTTFQCQSPISSVPCGSGGTCQSGVCTYPPTLLSISAAPNPVDLGQSITISFGNPQNADFCGFQYKRPDSSVFEPTPAITGPCSDISSGIITSSFPTGDYIIKGAAFKNDGRYSDYRPTFTLTVRQPPPNAQMHQHCKTLQ